MKNFFRTLVLVWAAVAASRTGAALPAEITVTAEARLELLRGDKVTGSIGLAPGEKLTLLDATGEYALVRYRNLNGRVLAVRTDLPRSEPAPPASAATTTATAPVAAVAPALPVSLPAAGPDAAHAPVNAVERALAGKLVRMDRGALRPCDLAQVAGVKFYAIYFSAGWCPPCREFTPGLVDAYAKLRALYPEFEVVLVNHDRSPADMFAYMRDDHMTWPAMRWDAGRSTPEIIRYCGDGIPCLVLVDENGRVLSDTNRGGSYVGPDAVLDDTWKILRDYRRKNPRPRG